MKVILAMIILIISLTGVVVSADESRDVANVEEDQVLSPEYLDRINAEQQTANAQRAVDRARHQKSLDTATHR